MEALKQQLLSLKELKNLKYRIEELESKMSDDQARFEKERATYESEKQQEVNKVEACKRELTSLKDACEVATTTTATPTTTEGLGR